MADISSQLNQKYDELRNIGNELATLVGREPKFPRKRANTNDEDAPPARRDSERRISHDAKDLKITIGSNDRKVISYEAVDRKRSRLIEDEPTRRSDRYEDDPPSRRPTLQSSVRMPTIETKSREEVLAERKSQTKADGARNRRMFGNLLLGTLKQFQKEEKAPDVAPKTQAQHDKLKEVEERLEKSVRQDKEKYLQDKKAVEMKLREKEMEIKRLKQRQAIQAKNENKIAHYKRLQNFIQTETKPPIFFLPARLTLRGMELLKQSSRNLDTLIKERQTEMENELRELEELSDGEIGGPAVRSLVRVVSHDKDARAHLKPMNGDDNKMDEPLDDEDDDDDDLDEVFKVRSTVVVKSDAKNGDSKDKAPEEKVDLEKKESGDKKHDVKESRKHEETEEIKDDDDKGKSKSNGDDEGRKPKDDEEKSKRNGDKEKSNSNGEKGDSKSKGREEGKKVSSKKHGSASPSD